MHIKDKDKEWRMAILLGCSAYSTSMGIHDGDFIEYIFGHIYIGHAGLAVAS